MVEVPEAAYQKPELQGQADVPLRSIRGEPFAFRLLRLCIQIRVFSLKASLRETVKPSHAAFFVNSSALSLYGPFAGQRHTRIRQK